MQNVAGNEGQSFWKKFSGGIKVPHTLVIIFSIIILMAIPIECQQHNILST